MINWTLLLLFDQSDRESTMIVGWACEFGKRECRKDGVLTIQLLRATKFFAAPFPELTSDD